VANPVCESACILLTTVLRFANSATPEDRCPVRALAPGNQMHRQRRLVMLQRSSRATLWIAGLATLALGGCANYVTKSDFDSTVAQLRAADQKQQQQLDQQQQQIEQISQQMKSEFSKYDAQITQLQGRIRVDTVSHFAFNSATLDAQDKQMLDGFAQVIREHHPDVLITVEGFADPAGTAAYNQRLGMRRAQAVRDYLIAQGMKAGDLRAVSYGDARNRLVKPGAWGARGEVNRRVSLVVDFAMPGVAVNAQANGGAEG
jgi:peptidoglycan-associated lipoprotein